MASTASPFVPAWKRLGLKLKGNPSAASSPSTEPSVPTNDLPKRTKRKAAAITDGDQDSTPSLKRKKSVSFSTEAKSLDKDVDQKIHQFAPIQATASIPPPKVQVANQKPSTPSSKPSTKERKPRKREVETKSEETQRYISYLQQFHTAREQWHFNKGRQTALLKNVFNVFRVPLEHDDALAAYLAGLQGQAARERLTQTANEILESTKHAADSSDDVTMSDNVHKEARDAALEKHLKDAKGRLRDQAAQEDSVSDDRLLLLRKRKRAELVLQGLGATQPNMATKSTASGQNIEPPAKKRTRRPNKARTGVPDDDLTDDTSSISSVPSSAGTADESSSEEESDSSPSDDRDSSSDGGIEEGSDKDGSGSD